VLLSVDGLRRTVPLYSANASRHATPVQVFAIYGAAASVAAELWRPRSVLPPLGRGFFTLLQGAWLVQIARIMWGGEVLAESLDPSCRRHQLQVALGPARMFTGGMEPNSWTIWTVRDPNQGLRFFIDLQGTRGGRWTTRAAP
jgi:Family of unknown function (DUF716)